MSEQNKTKCCGNCWHFADYTEEYKAKSGWDGACMFGRVREDDIPRKKTDCCKAWKPMHDTPCCDNCLHVVDMGGRENLVCGVGVPVYVKVNGVPTEAYFTCKGLCWQWKEDSP